MKSKKLSINKIIRSSILFIISIGILLCSYKLYASIEHTQFESKEIDIYSYNNNANVNYTVSLNPNNLYNTNSLDGGKIYISSLVDFIDTNFIYEYKGDTNTDIKGNYIITAKVQGFTIQDKSVITIWEKDFPIVSNKYFNSADNTFSITENIKLNLSEYNAFVEEIIETTKINCDTSLTLLMDINLKGTTNKGSFEENITPSIDIPLNMAMFQITTTNVEKPGAIEETIQVQLPVDKNQAIFYGAIIGICTLGLIFLIFFTQAAPKKDPLEKELSKIFKKHGDRLVALSADVDFTDAKYVRTIDDLVRLADELERPILYKYSDDYKMINTLYVINGDEIYVFDIKELMPIEDEQIEEIIEQIEVNSEQ